MGVEAGGGAGVDTTGGVTAAGPRVIVIVVVDVRPPSVTATAKVFGPTAKGNAGLDTPEATGFPLTEIVVPGCAAVAVMDATVTELLTLAE